MNHRFEGPMTSYWLTGVVLAALAVAWLVRRALRQTKRLEMPAATDIPLWDAEEHAQRDFWPELVAQSEDTAPAVLTPPQWTAPKTTHTGSERRSGP